MDDNRIIELFFKRDENALSEIEKKYAPLCFKISNNILGNTHDAEEIVNDTYLALWNAIPPERPNNLVAFVARIARNLSLKRHEHRSAQKRSAVELVSLSELDEIIPDQSFDSCNEERLGELISDFLRTEKPDARNVFLRKYWYFDSIESIAERYSFSKAKVKSMLFHTRKRLKHYLKNREVPL